jgi:hypothetical protein
MISLNFLTFIRYILPGKALSFCRLGILFGTEIILKLLVVEAVNEICCDEFSC